MYTTNLAAIYDTAHHFKNYPAEAEYILTRMREQHRAPQSLLETACGTGRYLELLRPHLAQVTGMDLSEAMLKRARERLPGVPFHQGDMTAFDLGRRFDVVCCLFRSIGYVKTRDRLVAAVIAMAKHLAPGGVLLIEPFFTPETYRVNRLTTNDYRSDNLSISWMYVSEREDLVARLRIHYLVGTPAGIENFIEVHEFGLFERRDFAEAFAAAGLTLTYDPRGPSGSGLHIGRQAAG